MSIMDEWLEKAKADAQSAKNAEKALRPKGQKCSNCTHHRGHAFSPKYHYCTLGKSKHTPCGNAKTMASGWCKSWGGKTMKITISPTDDQTDERHPYYTVSIEFPNDEGVNADSLVSMFHQAAVAWGFGSDAIYKAMNEFEP